MTLKYALQCIDFLVDTRGTSRKKEAWDVICKYISETQNTSYNKQMVDASQIKPCTLYPCQGVAVHHGCGFSKCRDYNPV